MYLERVDHCLGRKCREFVGQRRNHGAMQKEKGFWDVGKTQNGLKIFDVLLISFCCVFLCWMVLALIH